MPSNKPTYKLYTYGTMYSHYGGAETFVATIEAKDEADQKRLLRNYRAQIKRNPTRKPRGHFATYSIVERVELTEKES